MILAIFKRCARCETERERRRVSCHVHGGVAPAAALLLVCGILGLAAVLGRRRLPARAHDRQNSPRDMQAWIAGICSQNELTHRIRAAATACVATSDGAVHVLVAPLAIHTYHAPDYTRYDRIDLSDYMAVLRAFGSDVQLHVLAGLEHGRDAVAVISAHSGVCLLVHASSGQISVCHSQVLCSCRLPPYKDTELLGLPVAFEDAPLREQGCRYLYL